MPLDECIESLKDILPAERIALDAPMSEQTTFEIGGPADCLVFPASISEVKKIMLLVKEYSIPYTVIGNGSNILVLDKGIRGVVIKLGKAISYMRCDKERKKIYTGCGALLSDVSKFAADNGLAGLEFAIGIPGSIGGAVYMNAGAYGPEMKDVVTAVTAVDTDGVATYYSTDKLDFGYRHSVFQDNHSTVCEVELTLQAGDKEKIFTQMKDLTKRRENKQPLEMPSAGSTFKRPEGYYAGTLIDQSGLKGFSVGGAQISTKHAGFVVNTGKATAADVLRLIAEVQKRVYDKHGVKLHPEVRLIGEE